MHTHTGSQFIVSSEGLLWVIEFAQNFDPRGKLAHSWHAKPSMKQSPIQVVATVSHASPQLLRVGAFAVHYRLPCTLTLKYKMQLSEGSFGGNLKFEVEDTVFFKGFFFLAVCPSE